MNTNALNRKAQYSGPADKPLLEQVAHHVINTEDVQLICESKQTSVTRVNILQNGLESCIKDFLLKMKWNICSGLAYLKEGSGAGFSGWFDVAVHRTKLS